MREKCPSFGPDQIRPSQEVNLPAQVANTNAKRDCSMLLSHAPLVAFLLVLMTLPAYAFATDEQPANVLHYKTRNSMILVAVNIDGQNKTLVFDTGAEQTLMHWPQVSRGKKMVLWQRDYYYIDERSSLTVGNTRLSINLMKADLRGASMLKVADGVLGQDVLSTFSSIRINYRNHTIELFN
jgi:hypothetical protein